MPGAPTSSLFQIRPTPGRLWLRSTSLRTARVCSI
ncbi:mCG140525 [Mus musculus]|nr:mCG140525 [Mus musculus]